MAGSYCYDGTLTGLLTLYAHLLSEQVEPERISVELPAQLDLYRENHAINGDQMAAEQFWQQLNRRLSPASLKLLRYCLLADCPQQELLLYRYLLLASTQGSRIEGMLTHPWVNPVIRLGRQVAREAHRYLGFVRFQQLQDGIYFAAIAPEHRVLLLIGNHFAERFSDQRWLIHDSRHGEGILYDCGTRDWLLLPMELHEQPAVSRQEEQFQTLWRSYFATLAIPERTNLRLQQGKVPLKTRIWLTEFQPSP